MCVSSIIRDIEIEAKDAGAFIPLTGPPSSNAVGIAISEHDIDVESSDMCASTCYDDACFMLTRPHQRELIAKLVLLTPRQGYKEYDG